MMMIFEMMMMITRWLSRALFLSSKTSLNNHYGECNENENELGEEVGGPRVLWAVARERKRPIFMVRP
jgi:hypothetical protein